MFNWLSNFFRDKKTPTRPDKGEVDTSSGASVQAVIVVFGEEDLGNGARFLTHVLEAKPAEVAFTLVGRQEDHARLSNLAAYITRQVAMMGHICLGQIEFAKERPQFREAAILAGKVVSEAFTDAQFKKREKLQKELAKMDKVLNQAINEGNYDGAKKLAGGNLKVEEDAEGEESSES